MTTPETNPETTPETPAAPTAPAAPAAKKARNTLGLVALGLAVFGALLAVIPATNGFSWVILLGAFIVSIVALTRKGQGKGMALVALIVSFLFWIISIFVGIAVVATAVSESIDDAPSISAPSTSDEDTDEAPAETDAIAGVGDTVTTDDGAEITLLSVTLDATPPDDYLISEVRGTLVAVSMSMTNGTNEAISISESSVAGFIGDAEYEAAVVYGTESNEWYVYEEINPGLEANFTAYIDVPADTELDLVSFKTDLFFGDAVTFVAK
ncbi:DUF4352 domain-containing protein [Salinibacterium sp. UTAS2018]|uniref:DUF4352 domain-containing protein n=1 Tax=Salinibacterium sp. UTAS2018 TaxID=2508880 RepID=UPI001009546F|nr:DUF4352 domain-containing protein [Salinibacterium sp. UTAS2018]QAV69842.1 DUF4352 domain-containing protein [Salinibacterium sp. UTAS2018]